MMVKTKTEHWVFYNTYKAYSANNGEVDIYIYGE
jgi:hypothetical protein